MHQKRHFTRESLNGARHGLSTKDRFYHWVEKGDGCWRWKGYINKYGYGMFSATVNKARVTYQAHRKSWEFENGRIPDGIVVRHKCDNKVCVRPDHLELWTLADNTNDIHERIIIKHRRGEDHGGAKATAAIVLAIRSSNETSMVLAERYGLSPATILQIKNRITWKHVT